ncbi:hypothetical protein POSPLADRAFT_1059901 [Postia placenta MAD-698-R-SB12]|uniref:Uncharacterized protein n=1 Tax=Postia placenta MAD-698-R-SB12 TaxID=670580 RepID=A0A1X6MRE8_9APHY|nr:hypothetical protein POSPLADRAFT_1059901 [Postia placenta MAD-698-R-SB12]OSX58806.1 hypothetical protein POSPLADRAFT_1059901 [Postia placenta MAD-698-R-SB12]
MVYDMMAGIRITYSRLRVGEDGAREGLPDLRPSKCEREDAFGPVQRAATTATATAHGMLAHVAASAHE